MRLNISNNSHDQGCATIDCQNDWGKEKSHLAIRRCIAPTEHWMLCRVHLYCVLVMNVCFHFRVVTRENAEEAEAPSPWTAAGAAWHGE